MTALALLSGGVFESGCYWDVEGCQQKELLAFIAPSIS